MIFPARPSSANAVGTTTTSSCVPPTDGGAGVSSKRTSGSRTTHADRRHRSDQRNARATLERLAAEGAASLELRVLGRTESMGDDTAPVAGRATDEVATFGWAVRPHARAVRGDQIDPQRLGWRRRRDPGNRERMGQRLPTEPRDVAEARGADGRNVERGEAVEPCAHVSIKARSRVIAPPCADHPTARGRGRRGPRSGECRFAGIAPRGEQLVSPEGLMGLVTAGKRIPAISHAGRRGMLRHPKMLDRVGDAPPLGRRRFTPLRLVVCPTSASNVAYSARRSRSSDGSTGRA